MQKNEKEIESIILEKIKLINRELFFDDNAKNKITINNQLYLVCGLIMAGLNKMEMSDLKSNDDENNNDGIIILNNVEQFLLIKNCSNEKIQMIKNLFNEVFHEDILWKSRNGESVLKSIFSKIKNDIVPCFENNNVCFDFAGTILNSLNNYSSIDNDKKNDVVLTPRYIGEFMAKLARTNKDSVVLDMTMGSGGLLISGMDIMIRDSKKNITDKKELEEKIKHIKEQQIFGIELLDNIYMLSLFNMILMGGGSSNNIINGDSLNYQFGNDNFHPDVLLLNPPYSAAGKGLVFAEKAFNMMKSGYGCIIIQESAGSGQGLPYTKRILENNTLECSIKMPSGLFGSKARVNVYIFVFHVNEPHDKDKLVKFIDFSKDGYSRQNRKKSSQEVNLRNTDHKVERYNEILAHVLGKKTETNYYNVENGTIINDTITLDGNDWLINQHQKINIQPTEEDFKKVVADYLSWKVSTLLKGTV